MAGWFLDIVIEWLVRMIVKIVRRIKSLSWPVVTGTVTNARCERAAYGCHVADVHFDYTHQENEFSGFHEEPFLSHGVGEDYVRRFQKGITISVRVKPRNPKVTVALAD